MDYVYSYGLFGAVEDATIIRLKVYPKIKTKDEVASERWDISNDKSPYGPIAGGIAGWMKNCRIEECEVVDGEIRLSFEGNQHTGCTRVGGMAGFAESTIFKGGSVKGYYYALGFGAACGKVAGTIYSECDINVSVFVEMCKAETLWSLDWWINWSHLGAGEVNGKLASVRGDYGMEKNGGDYGYRVSKYPL